jgi:hypothetical protein
MILGCVDRNSAFAIPQLDIENILGELYKTPGRHWHIVLDENEAGELELLIPGGNRVNLQQFEFRST